MAGYKIFTAMRPARSRPDLFGAPAVLNLRVGLDVRTFSTYGRNASCRYSRVASDGIRVMMIGSALLGRIAKKLHYHTLVNLEFYPAVNGDMRSYSHNHDDSYDDL